MSSVTDWAIYWTLGNFSKPLATIILAKFCKVVKIFNLVKSFWATFIDFGDYLLVTLLVRTT